MAELCSRGRARGRGITCLQDRRGQALPGRIRSRTSPMGVVAGSGGHQNLMGDKLTLLSVLANLAEGGKEGQGQCSRRHTKLCRN